MPWYALSTKVNAEQKALDNLMAQDFACFLPKASVEKLRRGKRTVCIEPLFPRYMFVELGQEDNFQSVRNTRGVQDFVRLGQMPATLDGAIIESIKQRCGLEGITTNDKLPKALDRVEILHGPYQHLEAVFQCSDGEQRSVVLLSILQSQVMLHVANTSIRKVM
jgi:transcriptional antiterminator RfaH